MVSTPRRSARTLAAAALLGVAGFVLSAPQIAVPALAQSPLFPELRTDDGVEPRSLDRDALRSTPLSAGRLDPSLIDRLEESGLGEDPGGVDGRRGVTRADPPAGGQLPPDPRDGPLPDDASSRDFDLFGGPAAAPEGRDARDAGSLPVEPARAFQPRPELDETEENLLAQEPVPREPTFSPRPLPTGPATGIRAVSPGNPPLAAGLADEALAVDSPLRTTRTAILPGRAPVAVAEADPFAPLGLRAGRFILFPQLIQTLGASTNLDDEPDGEAGVFSETTISARLLSDWSRHEAELNGSLTYRRNFAGDRPEDPRAAFDGRLRLDIDRMTTATLRGAVDYAREDADGTADFLTGTDQADRLQGSLAGQLERRFGRLVLSGTGTVARSVYPDLPVGAIDQDYTTLTATLRAGYEISPAIAPFLEGSVGRRIFDVEGQEAGGAFDRDALLPALRSGIAFDFTEKLRGEAALGYAWNRPDDARGEDTSAPTLDASLVWSPQRGTELTAAARTRFEPESSGRSTDVAYEGSLGLRHALNTRTELTATALAEYTDSTVPEDDELLLVGEAGFTYWLHRGFAVTGLYSHRELYTDTSTGDYGSDTIRFGMTLQR
ncbi:outer membrane beta-barrel protein [Aurantimonas sp. A2-1-M11]|uniref:outer membrane beta-barrel protein n=1 Tax=Aurantimonas sp. A2-1-M11 TaxID=3113712 RepID=UPI002F925B06